MSLVTLVLTDVGITSLALGGATGLKAGYDAWIAPRFHKGAKESSEWGFVPAQSKDSTPDVMSAPVVPMGVPLLTPQDCDLLKKVRLTRRDNSQRAQVDVLSEIATIAAKVRVIDEVAGADSARRVQTQRVLADLRDVVDAWNTEHETLRPALAVQVASLVSGIAQEIDRQYQGALTDAKNEAIVSFGSLSTKYAVDDLSVPHDKPFADPENVSVTDVLAAKASEVKRSTPEVLSTNSCRCGRTSVAVGDERFCMSCGTKTQHCECDALRREDDTHYTSFSGFSYALPVAYKGQSDLHSFRNPDGEIPTTVKVSRGEVVALVSNQIVSSFSGSAFLVDRSLVQEMRDGFIENLDGGAVRVFTSGTIRHAKGVHFGYVGPDAVIEDAVDCVFADVSPRAKVSKKDCSRVARWPNTESFEKWQKSS